MLIPGSAVNGHIAVQKSEDRPLDSKGFRISWDLWALALLLILANFHLITKNPSPGLLFSASAVAGGEWWRIFTYPFVHASFYHLLLDAAAFFTLYTSLADERWPLRMFSLQICSFFSLGAVLLFEPEIYGVGLGGLSGVGHGLMALTSLEMMEKEETFKIGAASFGLVVVKSISEILTGRVFFAFGLCGVPLEMSHAGGVIGGIAAYAAVRRRMLFSIF